MLNKFKYKVSQFINLVCRKSETITLQLSVFLVHQSQFNDIDNK